MVSVKQTLRSGRKELVAMTEGELLWLFCETGSRKYYGELFIRYLPLVYGVCLRRFIDSSRSAEAVEELFDGLWSLAIEDPLSIDDFGLWLYDRICEYRWPVASAADLHDGILRIEEGTRPLSEGAAIAAAFLDGDDQRAWQIFRQGCARMNKTYRECLRLFFLVKKSFGEIAEITGMQTPKVRAAVFRGLEELATNGRVFDSAPSSLQA